MIPTDAIVCFEAGSIEQRPWCATLRNVGGDFESLERLAQERVIDLEVKGDIVSVNGKDRVGMVVLPSGRRLIIRTKIPSASILDWLVYLGEIPNLATWLREASVGSGDDFHICIGRLFLHELDTITRTHLRKEYMAATTEVSLMRGRLLTTRLAYRIHRLPRLPLAYRCRTLETPHNSVLAWRSTGYGFSVRNSRRKTVRGSQSCVTNGRPFPGKSLIPF